MVVRAGEPYRQDLSRARALGEELLAGPSDDAIKRKPRNQLTNSKNPAIPCMVRAGEAR
jgi:hypothetical protein